MMIATQYLLADDANREIWVDGCHLDGGRDQCVLEVTKGVGKVVVQGLHGILELVCW